MYDRFIFEGKLSNKAMSGDVLMQVKGFQYLSKFTEFSQVVSDVYKRLLFCYLPVKSHGVIVASQHETHCGGAGSTWFCSSVSLIILINLVKLFSGNK